MLGRMVAGMMMGCAAVAGMLAPATAVAAEKKVLMVNWRGFTESEAAFKARLEELGIVTEITEVDAAQDRGKLAETMRTMEGDIVAGKWDAIYSYGTSVTQVVTSVVKDRIPVIFTIVFDPVGGNLIKSMEEPGVNMTGVTNGVPIEDQFAQFQKLTPFKELCVLFNAREPNSNIIEARVTKWANSNGVNMSSHRVASGSDALDRVLADIKDGKVNCDIVYAGADSYLASEAVKIRDAIGDKVPLYGGTETFVLRGWFGAYAPQVKDMGINAADLMARVFKGEDAAKIPVVLPQPYLFVTESLAGKFNANIPDGAIRR